MAAGVQSTLGIERVSRVQGTGVSCRGAWQRLPFSRRVTKRLATTTHPCCVWKSISLHQAQKGPRSVSNDAVEFDLQLAVTLAGAAFESYNEPKAEKMYIERTVNNTETTYVNREYVEQEFSGIAKVHVKRAEGLPARDLWGTSDPYVTLSIGDSFARSVTVGANCSPEWDEMLYLFVRDKERQRLLVRVYDADVIGSDDALGVAYLPLSACCDGSCNSFTLSLTGDGGGGEITFDFQFLPLTAAELEDTSLTNVPIEPVSGTPTRVLDAWSELASLAGGSALPLEKLDPVCYVDNVDTDTQAWILWNVGRRHLCVAFRGTEQAKLKDIVTDLNLVTCNFDVERSVGNFFDRSVPQVHSGFMSAFDSVKVKLLAIIDSIVGDNSDGWTIYVTGHSLGGALATLFAFELGSRRWGKAVAPPALTMYNFGSPRVGNAEFASMYNAAVRDSWRVFNKNDIVSSVPRMGNYKHVDNAVAASAEGTLEIMGDHAIKDVLGEGTNVEDVVPELLKKGLDLESNEELKALIDQEMEILASLSSGKGIAEHLEDFYLSVFQKVIHAISGSLSNRNSQ
uniref:Triglyceride lipase n=1 Tax=Tetraselmis sp. GSL018 TaxID=582737 RepID=A0A061R3D8_9CHLO|eukprot:CAMPEP_0177600256 /NCGR_PEP_ID=MMETSP0419_2-20121207/13509_1 /TAXON_ID=582737 /ORGANISM="Tetraselmis sp., Strain GSL018" /LENGTH=568 /DNA_ID=CAMNT_0019093203 /DNA_START=17 /DNA_END=1723 /DNA_ORIENTATION=+